MAAPCPSAEPAAGQIAIEAGSLLAEVAGPGSFVALIACRLAADILVRTLEAAGRMFAGVASAGTAVAADIQSIVVAKAEHRILSAEAGIQEPTLPSGVELRLLQSLAAREAQVSAVAWQSVGAALAAGDILSASAALAAVGIRWAEIVVCWQAPVMQSCRRLLDRQPAFAAQAALQRLAELAPEAVRALEQGLVSVAEQARRSIVMRCHR